MLAVGDVNLLSAQKVMSLVTRNRPSPYSGKIRSRLGFCKVHRAGPLARHHRGKIPGFLFIAAFEENRFSGRLREHRTQPESHIGGVPHLLNSAGQGLRQPLTTVPRIEDKTRPAGFAELGICLPPCIRRGHYTLINCRPALISCPVDRRKNIGRELCGLLKHGVGHIFTGVFKPRPRRDLFEASEIQRKTQITQRCSVVGHLVGLRWLCRNCSLFDPAGSEEIIESQKTSRQQYWVSRPAGHRPGIWG